MTTREADMWLVWAIKRFWVPAALVVLVWIVVNGP
jgi:hypothetical protein